MSHPTHYRMFLAMFRHSIQKDQWLRHRPLNDCTRVPVSWDTVWVWMHILRSLHLGSSQEIRIFVNFFVLASQLILIFLPEHPVLSRKGILEINQTKRMFSQKPVNTVPILRLLTSIKTTPTQMKQRLLLSQEQTNQGSGSSQEVNMLVPESAQLIVSG